MASHPDGQALGCPRCGGAVHRLTGVHLRFVEGDLSVDLLTCAQCGFMELTQGERPVWVQRPGTVQVEVRP